jgi:NAD(P)-dependent dehydrogenase (short-subunit alcohol dehydrogenase family)
MSNNERIALVTGATRGIGLETVRQLASSGGVRVLLAGRDANKAAEAAQQLGAQGLPVESIALEYSRYNYNATNFYAPAPFRASDHDPIIVGLDMEKDRGNKR